jgi:hypothetical protein
VRENRGGGGGKNRGAKEVIKRYVLHVIVSSHCFLTDITTSHHISLSTISARMSVRFYLTIDP